MKRSFRCLLGLLALAIVGSSTGAAILSAAERSEKARPHGEQIDLFAAVKGGQAVVQFIPQDENQGRLLVTNKTDKPLSVKLPESFVGVPVLAAMGGMPFGGNGAGAGFNPGGNPGGGIFPGGNNPGGGINLPGSMGGPLSQSNAKSPQRVGGGTSTAGPAKNGWFNVAPEATQQVKLETVCLDYGHPCPRPAMKYDPHGGRRYGQGGRGRSLRVARPAGDRPSRRPTGRLASEQRHELGEARRIADEAGHRHDPLVYERRDRRGEEGGREGAALHKERQEAAKPTSAGAAK